MISGPTLGMFGCGVIHEVGAVREVGRGKRVKIKLAGFPMDAFSDRTLGLMELELRITDNDKAPPKKGLCIWISGGTYEIGLGSEGTRYNNLYAFSWWAMHPEKLPELFGTAPTTTPSDPSGEGSGNVDVDAAALAAARAAAEGATPNNEPSGEAPSGGSVPDDDDPDIPW